MTNEVKVSPCHIVRQVDTPAASLIGGTMGAEQQIMGYREVPTFHQGLGGREGGGGAITPQ